MFNLIRKIDFGQQWLDTHHRSGWAYAMNALRPLHVAGGVRLEGFIEKKFAWGRDPGDRYNHFAPFDSPWVGFWHNPPGIPPWFDLNDHAPEDILASERWKESSIHCRGLFTLSAYLRRWLEPRVSVPVCNLLHPTETPSIKFTMDVYRANGARCVVQVGWWLRRFRSIYQLPVMRMGKALLSLGFPWTEMVHIEELRLLEPNAPYGFVEIIPYLEHRAYDELLAQNIVLLHLYDASANNALIECLVRETPILVNRLEPVVEYLGDNYPFYFDTLEHAAILAEDTERVAAAHEYLAQLGIKELLTAEAFRRSFHDSTIYHALRVEAREEVCA